VTCHSTITNRISRFSSVNKQASAWVPVRNAGEHGEQIVYGDKLPEEKIDHNVLCSCGSDTRRKRTLKIEVLSVRKFSRMPKELSMAHHEDAEIEMLQRWAAKE